MTFNVFMERIQFPFNKESPPGSGLAMSSLKSPFNKGEKEAAVHKVLLFVCLDVKSNH